MHNWNLDFVKKGTQDKYLDLANSITDALKFMKACGFNKQNVPEFKQVEFYTSHEALLLNYEEALTREDSLKGGWYDCSAHMLWIGERTRNLDEAHVEFMRGIKNPIGVKIGPNVDKDYLIKRIHEVWSS